MWNIPDHPDIDCAMRTGYPSWMQDNYEDDDEKEEDEYNSRSIDDAYMRFLGM